MKKELTLTFEMESEVSLLKMLELISSELVETQKLGKLTNISVYQLAD